MSKKIINKNLLLPLAALILAGCVSGPEPSQEEVLFGYLEELPHNEVMPTEAQLAGSGPRVVVFETDNAGIELAKSARTGQVVTGEIERLLAGTEVELVDRQLATKLGEELQLAEMRGNNDYQGEQIADFAILARLSHVGVDSSVTASGCSFSGDVAGTVRIYRIPSMRPVATETLEGSAKGAEGRVDGCAISSNRAQQLTRESAVRGVSVLQGRLHQLFAPTGYVIEKRISAETFVKITLGTRHNLKAGDTVEIMEVIRTTNPLTKRETIETAVLGTGLVSGSLLRSESAWISLQPGITEKVRFGQPVRIQLAR